MRSAKFLPNRSRPHARHLRLECFEDRTIPATFVVTTALDELTPGDNWLSLREAIFAANNNPGPDAIILPPGIYRMTIPGANENDGLTGDYDVSDDLTILGFGPRLSVIDAQQMDRVFELVGPINVRFIGVTLEHGATTHGAGGVQALDANVTLARCAVIDNVGKQGGGINAEGGALTVIGSAVRGNVAEFDGGGIRAANNLTLTNSTVSGNNSLSCGGIEAETATVTNSTISGNTATLGGGILADQVTMTSSTVSGNSAGVDGSGGGVEAITATLTNCTIAGNTAGTGGGIEANTANLLNCTVAGNAAHTGGGLHATGFGLFSLRNTIVARNVADVSDPDVSGGFVSGGHNLIGDGTGSNDFTNGVNGDIVGTAASPIDPRLGPLQNNGGRTQTMALLPGSPAIDHGDNVNVPAADQRGFPRVRDGNGDGVAIVDIGAFER